MFNSSKSSAQFSSTSPTSPIASVDPIPIRFPLSPILAACLNFNMAQSGGTITYSCTTCNKVFPTTQALGGHQNAHRKERNAQFAREQRLDEENDRDKTAVLSPDPFRWAWPHWPARDIHNEDDGEGEGEKIIIGKNIISSNNMINKNGVMYAYEFFHFMPLAGDLNPKAAGLAFGSGGSDGGASGSGTKKPFGHDGGSCGPGAKKRLIGGDHDGDNALKKKKKAKYWNDDDLRVLMPSVNLTLATGSGNLKDSDSGLGWGDGEYMYVWGGNGGASTSKTEEPDVTLKL